MVFGTTLENFYNQRAMNGIFNNASDKSKFIFPIAIYNKGGVTFSHHIKYKFVS